MFATIRE